ncbi:MAG: nucleotidyltransferase domain-containing protein [Microgenomates group bacterium]
MSKRRLIQKTGDYYHLPGRKSLVVRRLQRHQFSAPQLDRAKSIASQLSKFSFIKSIYLTGSLAMSNSPRDADIDFMIITEDGVLWTTRFLITIYVSLLGLRRTPASKDTAGKLCLNLYLSPSSYLIPPSKQNLYTAYELIQAVPLYDPEGTRSELLAANSWIKQHLPNAIGWSDLPPRSDLLRKPRLGGVFSRLQNTIRRPGQTFMDILESFFYNLQLLYMRKKITREYITKTSAFFHPHDPGAKVLKKLNF